jgi:hypothetical protein
MQGLLGTGPVTDSARFDITLALSTLLRELIDGSNPSGAWVLNPDDPGLLRSLDKLSAAASRRSAHVAGGRSAPTESLGRGSEQCSRKRRAPCVSHGGDSPDRPLDATAVGAGLRAMSVRQRAAYGW